MKVDCPPRGRGRIEDVDGGGINGYEEVTYLRIWLKIDQNEETEFPLKKWRNRICVADPNIVGQGFDDDTHTLDKFSGFLGTI